jgi:hypothetical protein
MFPARNARCAPAHDCMKNDELLLVLTAEFSVDLGSCLRLRKHTRLCFLLLTDVFYLKIHWAEVQSCFLFVR